MTIYQILFMDKVPTSAAVDEAVKIAKRKDGQQAGNFINAVYVILCGQNAEMKNQNLGNQIFYAETSFG